MVKQARRQRVNLQTDASNCSCVCCMPGSARLCQENTHTLTYTHWMFIKLLYVLGGPRDPKDTEGDTITPCPQEADSLMLETAVTKVLR